MAVLTKGDKDRILMYLGYPDRVASWWTSSRNYRVDSVLDLTFSDVTTMRIYEIFDELSLLEGQRKDAKEKGLAVVVGAITINLAAYENSIRYQSRLLVQNLSQVTGLDVYRDIFGILRNPGLTQYQ